MEGDSETSNTKTKVENNFGSDKFVNNDNSVNNDSSQTESCEVDKSVTNIPKKIDGDVDTADTFINTNNSNDDNGSLNTGENESKDSSVTSLNKTQNENTFFVSCEDDAKDTNVTISNSEIKNTIEKFLNSNQDNNSDTTLTINNNENNDIIEKSLSSNKDNNSDAAVNTLTINKSENNDIIEKSLSSNEDKNSKVADTTLTITHSENKDKNNGQSLDSSKESEVENVDAIKKFIEDQEKEIQIQEKEVQHLKNISVQNYISIKSEVEQDERENESNDNNESVNLPQEPAESLTIASNLMDIVLSQSEAEIDKKMVIKTSPKDSLSIEEKGNNGLALKIGSDIEARHFDEYWYPAKIVEVDYEEMEVLIHYDNVSKKHDEWICVSSPRLRPIVSLDKTKETVKVNVDAYNKINVKEEPVADEKSKLLFVVGERCLARWRDNRRFLATIQKDLDDGQYEIMFDDGFHWTCSASRLYKFKESIGRNADPLIIGPSSSFPSSSNISQVTYNSAPSKNTIISNISQMAPYHKHLFDPTRDYLGSKSERREMKRKLNIKEIFNIGQKRRKIETTAPHKLEKSKKPNIIKKKTTETVKKPEIKREIPEAVASIIGTINTFGEESLYEQIKMEKEVKDIEAMDAHNNIKDEQQNTEIIPELAIKKELDPIEEETELERFEVQDEDKHVKVIDKIKEAIIKLEDVINKEKKVDSSISLSLDQKENLPIDTEKNLESDSMSDNNEDVLLCSSLKEDLKLESVKNLNYDAEDNVDTSVKNLKNDAEDNVDTANEAKVIVDSSTGIVNESKIERTDSVEIKPVTNNSNNSEKVKKKLWKIKKGKKLRLLQDKKVKKQVEKVKSELEEMKKQMEEMKKEMILKTAELANRHQSGEMPESFLLPGEWCCKWVNGQPLGTVSEVEIEVKLDANNKPVLPRRSVQVEDKRLPPGWTKHMVRRSWGNSAGKWDVVLVSPENRRLHTRSEMRNYLEHIQDESLKGYEHTLYDFGAHLKLARRMGWVTNTPDGAVEEPVSRIPSSAFSSSPIVKRPFISPRKRKLGLKKRVIKVNTKKKFIRPAIKTINSTADTSDTDRTQSSEILPNSMDMSPNDPLEDGYVFVGSLKVQVIDNLLRCPAEGCFKNFRNNTLIKMHIKHYHRELIKMLGATPKVLDLAYARTIPNKSEPTRHKTECESKIIKVKLPKVSKREDTKQDIKDIGSELQITLEAIEEHIPKPINDLESPKLRSSLLNRPVKRPRVLLPVRRPDPPEEATYTIKEENIDIEQKDASNSTLESVEPLDFETAISTHTVTRPAQEYKKKAVKHRSFANFSKRPMSEEDDWCGINSDVDTRSSYPRSGTPDSKILENKGDSLNHPVSSESNEEQKEPMYMCTETGEHIKIVHMKREEIINCHCGVREEDGLMVQCELCLCWQHALCHNIHKESEVPEKYTCSICLNPRRGRRSARFVHDQDRLYEGLLPGAKPCETLRRSHELSGNLLKIQDALHALRVKYYVATKKNHPKLYLWAKDWENGELNLIQEKLNSDYSDLNIMISDIGKENLPVKPEEMKDPLEIRSSPMEPQDHDGEKYSQREGQIGSQSLLSGLLSSPGGASLDLPISATDLERLAKSVPERVEVAGPEPEAAIENSACRERLLRHIQRCQAIIDSRLDSIEAQVAELESQDPSFEDDETADYFPRTKQTVQMLLRDLDTMEELGIIT